MVYLSEGDVREAPTSERSFLAGETERNFVFEITNWNTRNFIHHGFGDASGDSLEVAHQILFFLDRELAKYYV
jgi:hypothetical protein